MGWMYGVRRCFKGLEVPEVIAIASPYWLARDPWRVREGGPMTAWLVSAGPYVGGRLVATLRGRSGGSGLSINRYSWYSILFP